MLYNLSQKIRNYHPDKEQLDKINSLKPSNQPDYDETELIVIPFAASNNLIHSSLGTWSIKTLEAITASYQYGGQDLMLDHQWEDSTKTIGIVFDAEMWDITPNDNFLDYLLRKSPNIEWDKKILNEQGYQQVTLFGAVEVSHFINSEFRYGRKTDVSIGGFGKMRYLCPLCSTNGKQVEFTDEECPHYMPTQWNLAYASEKELQAFAPYYIRDGWDFSAELSMVFEGNCVQARVIDERFLQMLSI
ncbi:MAG: hypothetical protein AB4372_04910 [Xenococcus sp. (in: cyanobacteria)]